MERRKRRWWTRGITWLSLLVISGAVVSGLFQLAVALAPGYRDEVAARASTALGQPVEVDQLSLRWRWLRPLLELNGVRLLDAPAGTPIVEIGRIRLGFALKELLRGEWVPGEVEVERLSLALQVTPENTLRLKGRVQNRPGLSFSEIAEQLKRFSRLRAEAVALTIEDLQFPEAGFAARLQRGDLRIDAQGFELRAELQAAQALASRLRLRAGITGDLADPARWQGRWTLDASGLVVGAPASARWPALAALQLGEASLTAAGDWQQGALGSSELSLRAQQMGLRKQPASMLKEVDIGLYYRPSEDGGTVDVVPLRLTGGKGAWPTTTARVEWRRAPAPADGTPAPGLQWSGNSDFLRLDDLAPWAAAFWPATANLPQQAVASLRGDLSRLEGRWQADEGGKPRYNLHAGFEGLGGEWPGQMATEKLQGELTADERSGRLTLKGDAATLRLPEVFDSPARFTKLAAEAQWQREGERWRLTVPRFDWAALGAEGEGNAELRLADGSKPSLKLAMRFRVADVAALKPLMPRHWGQPLKDWLDRALVRGRINNAQLDIDGPLADFPFHSRPTGRWSLKLPVSGARLEYQPDWPGVDQLAATVQFEGNGLSFEAQRGLINGVAVTAAKGSITDFNTAPLLLDGKTVGEAPFYYAFLRASPLAARLQNLLAHTEAEGPAETDVHLEIPLHSHPGQKTVVEGEVRLKGNNLRHTALDRPVRDITGSLRFGGAGVVAEALRGQFHDTPVTARIGPMADGSEQLTAALRVDFAAERGLAAHYVPGWLRSHLHGSADWRLAVPLSGPQGGQVRLESSLAGTRSSLPPPLSKSAETTLPLSLLLSGDDTVPLRLSADIPGKLGLSLRFARASPGAVPEVRGVRLRLGEGAPPAFASEDGLQVNGVLDRFDPSEWRGLLMSLSAEPGAQPAAGAGLPFLGVVLDAGQLRLGSYNVPQARLELKREYGGYRIALNGPGTAGELRLTTAGDALSGRFASLRLDPLPKSAAQPSPATAETVSEPVNPLRAPTLDVAVDAIRIGGRDFGSLRLASERTAVGQRFSRFALSGGIASFEAEGDWRRSGGMTEARSRFTLASDDLAGTLEGLGFAPNISGRGARITGDLTWPAAARGFEWAQGRGTVSLVVESGTLRTVEPGGTGRVLGLFNFYALPRRLTLDFGDVVAKGLGFDRIEGQFKLANGVAHTDDLTVRGPSVKIAVRGDVGLAAQDYDQIITVTPNTSSLTLGALLLGGAASVAAPVLPILAVIANQVIDIPLGQVTQLTYGLTGSWENPEIRKLEQVPSPATEETKP